MPDLESDIDSKIAINVSNEENINNEVDNMGYAVDLFQEEKSQAINTKEDFELLNGLFMGNHIYEETASLRQVKVAKIIDML